MRVGFNASLLSAGADFRRTGVSRYIAELLEALPAALDPDDEMVLFGAPHASEQLRFSPGARVTNASGKRSFAHPAARPFWEQLALPVLVARERCDLVHGPVNVVPLAVRCPTVVTIHDLAFLRVPGHVPAGRRRYLTAMVRLSVRRARRVLTISESTKRDLMDLFGVPDEKITVTPLAADARFTPPGSEALARFRERYGLARPYIVAVGTLEPRKNLPLLLRAFGRIASDIPHDLVLVGPLGWMIEGMDEAVQGLPKAVRQRIRFTGFVPDDDLPLWYAGASVMVYPSRYEGFGLPVLEAMASGVPVITSNVSALPEVAGDAALLIDPRDKAALAGTIRHVLGDDRLATEMRARGLRRAAEFSWERTAAATVAAYRAALG